MTPLGAQRLTGGAGRGGAGRDVEEGGGSGAWRIDPERDRSAASGASALAGLFLRSFLGLDIIPVIVMTRGR